jgi:hypothetical protein
MKRIDAVEMKERLMDEARKKDTRVVLVLERMPVNCSICPVFDNCKERPGRGSKIRPQNCLLLPIDKFLGQERKRQDG